MDFEDEVSQRIAAVAGQIGSAVVGVSSEWGVGSGIVVSEGAILTNAHNVRGKSVRVTFSDGRSEEAEVRGVDPDGDLAVLSAPTADSPVIEWSTEPGPASLGKGVFALSNPGGRGLRVTFGRVSGTDRAFRGPRGRRIAGSIEHTAPLLPGSSGGPIVDAGGNLLGINTHRLGEGFYLSIPADSSLEGKLQALIKGESPQRLRLGIGFAPPHVSRRLRRAVGLEEADGLLVRAVEEVSPAARAGIKEGDLVTHVGEVSIKEPDDVFNALDAVSRGDTLKLALIRGTEKMTVEVTPEAR